MGRLITFVVMLPILFLLAVGAASEWGGEVVEVETYDARGRRFSTSLWIVDFSGDSWLRASDPEATWVERIRERPEIVVERDGVRFEYRARIVDGYSEKINAAMRERYGLADQITGVLRDPDAVVAIRLIEDD